MKNKDAKINKDFGNYIRRARSLQGLSQVKLANLSGIPTHSIIRIENSQYGTSLASAKQLSNALGIPLNEIIKEIE